MSSLPVGYILYILQSTQRGDAADANFDELADIELVKLIRLLRLFKLLRLARLRRLIKQYDAIFYSLMQRLKIFKLILYIVIVSHWLCCAWHYVGSTNHVLPNGLIQTG